MTFGQKLQTLRKEAGLSQEALAETLGVSRQAVSKWERDSGYPETEKLLAIARLFHVTLDALGCGGCMSSLRRTEAAGFSLDQAVTLDALLNQDNADLTSSGEREASAGDNGLSLETAAGFLRFQCRRTGLTALALGLMTASLSLTFWELPGGMAMLMAILLVGMVLLLAARLAENPYRALGPGPLAVAARAKPVLQAGYARWGKRLFAGELAGIALVAAGLLLVPLLLPDESVRWENLLLSAGMLLTGLGVFLWVGCAGIRRVCRRMGLSLSPQLPSTGGTP